MKLQRHDLRGAEPVFGTRQSQLFTDASHRPFRTAIAVLDAGQASQWHAHLDGEMFVILSGTAEIETAGRVEHLTAGDAVELDPPESHRVRNRGTSPMTYLKIWWGDRPLKLAADAAPRSSTLITATPPTPNGDLHLGHLSGPYLRADIYRRFLRMLSHQTVFVTGLDDHQSYVAKKAAGPGETPDVVADRFGSMIRHAWRATDIEPDVVLQPRTSVRHRELVHRAVTNLVELGHIVERMAPALVCETTDRVLFEAYVAGVCPHCGSDSNGNVCEVCCRPNDCFDLASPRSLVSEGPVRRTSYRRLFFKLSAFAAPLADYVRKAQLSTSLRALAEQMLADGLPDIAVSHRTDWGLPVGVAGYEDQRLYVWFEMALAYLAAAEEAGPRYQDIRSDPDSEIVQFFGMDNGYFHVLLFPAIYMALGWTTSLPTAMLTNEFLLLEGSKFSTSRNHAIWAGDFLRRQPSDLVRYALALLGPERSQTNFTLDSYRTVLDAGPCGPWRTWIEKLDLILESQFDRCAPEPGLFLPDHAEFSGELATLHRSGLSAYKRESYSPGRAARVASELVFASQRLLDGDAVAARVATMNSEWRTTVALQLSAIRTFSFILTPLMPQLAGTLRHALDDHAGDAEEDPLTPRLIRPRARIQPLTRAFLHIGLHDAE